MSNLNRSAFQGHPFHLVSPSPWPIFTCISLYTLTTSGVLTMHGFSYAGNWSPLSFVLLISSMFFWFRDVISEGTYLGNHTLAVQRGLNMGVGLFIVSEALFFLAIFWAYFHSALSPTVEVGAQWPPMGIEAINAFELPLLNTVILLASGVTITYSHHSLIQGNRNAALSGAVFTILLAAVFIGLQGIEYSDFSFTLSDNAYRFCGLRIIGITFLQLGLMVYSYNYAMRLSQHFKFNLSIHITVLFLLLSVIICFTWFNTEAYAACPDCPGIEGMAGFGELWWTLYSNIIIHLEQGGVHTKLTVEQCGLFSYSTFSTLDHIKVWHLGMGSLDFHDLIYDPDNTGGKPYQRFVHRNDQHQELFTSSPIMKAVKLLAEGKEL